jgi:hypothetical protein
MGHKGCVYMIGYGMCSNGTEELSAPAFTRETTTCGRAISTEWHGCYLADEYSGNLGAVMKYRF